MMMKHIFCSRKLSPWCYYRGKGGKGEKNLMLFLSHETLATGAGG